jgi:hypothetical protein
MRLWAQQLLVMSVVVLVLGVWVVVVVVLEGSSSGTFQRVCHLVGTLLTMWGAQMLRL